MVFSGKIKWMVAGGLLAIAGSALAQTAIPPIPQMRPGSQPIIRVGADGQQIETEAAINVTRFPVQGEFLFDFDFAHADVLDLRRGLIDRGQAEADGVLLPTQLLFDPREYNAVVVRLLDKITTELETRTVPIGVSTDFGTLSLSVSACLKNPSNRTPESSSFIRIIDSPGNKEPEERFAGWMFASSPALNALDHAVYDVWVIDCVNVDVEQTASG